ncbi:MAG TPA: aspartate aminotransferase family protein, partial [Ruminococcus sp.]|nr:aspartate aminotransferase family protein [Ruminococcus sp.]
MSKSENVIEKFDNSVMHSYGRYPMVLEHGEGRTACDEDGKRYIDFGSGIGTNSLGYCDEEWADAVCAQVRKLQHNSNYYYT